MHEITAPTLCNHKLLKLVNRNKRTGQKFYLAKHILYAQQSELPPQYKIENNIQY